MQGVVMMILPIGFAYFIYKQNPGHFDVMLQTDMGRKLLGLAIGLQIIGMIMIKKVSTMKF
jgi:Flp pilus assembly protein TadB